MKVIIHILFIIIINNSVTEQTKIEEQINQLQKDDSIERVKENQVEKNSSKLESVNSSQNYFKLKVIHSHSKETIEVSLLIIQIIY